MAAASSLSFLPLAPRRPLLLRHAARHGRRNVGGAMGPLRLARLRLPRGRAAATVAGEAELPMEEAEAALRVAADDDSITATVVIYLSVQDFLQKREREKFEKEEAERQKEEARKKRAKARKKRRNY
ncbi:uncharacterized protein LOC133912160 isoform X2 [Phragmites australis]|uniref:uncharacterized protein LOC133912160 isoform X2 n=1 Tax=Phragmites australis TaxID=29695 RepID=UPI002D771F73|nr:uncharacterized protein LOC133912160 isoform X2 [Phragmites australis]